MKKNILVYIVILLVIFLAWIILEKTQVLPENQAKNDKVKVVTTIFPLYDIVDNIGKDKVETLQILPSGASVHSYEPSVADLKELKNAQAIFYIGHGLDNWVLSLAESTSIDNLIKTDKYVQLLEKTDKHSHDDDHGHDDEDYNDGLDDSGDPSDDPHYWLSLDNGQAIARQVAEKLSLLDPENSQYYMDNLDKYIEDMRVSKIYLDSQLEDLEDNKVLVFHNAWQYLARDFNLEVIGALKDSEAHEEGPRHLEEIYDLVEKEEIKTIYGEEQLSTEQIKPIAEDLDLQILKLDPLGANEEVDSYIKLIEYNVLKIYEGQSSRN